MKYQNTAFHEAVYVGSVGCLEAMIQYARRQHIEFETCVDANGMTPLALAKHQAHKSKKGALECLRLLEADAEVSQDPALLFEHVLLVDLTDSDGTYERKRIPLPSDRITWAELLDCARKAAAQVLLSKTDWMRTHVLVHSVAVTDSDEYSIKEFFATWKHAFTVGFNKCSIEMPEAHAIVADAVLEQLASLEAACWQRVYVFEAMRPNAATPANTDATRALASSCQQLANLLAEKP
eukprot:3157684-Amphidinium_carterae.2